MYYVGIPAGIDPRIHEMLQSIVNRRDDHCVRSGFLHQTRAMIRRCGYDGTDDCSGTIQMYISHFPCISCIAIFCQFIRFFPGVRLEMDFDDMLQPSVGDTLKPNAWKVQEVMAGGSRDSAGP